MPEVEFLGIHKHLLRHKTPVCESLRPYLPVLWSIMYVHYSLIKRTLSLMFVTGRCWKNGEQKMGKLMDVVHYLGVVSEFSGNGKDCLLSGSRSPVLSALVFLVTMPGFDSR